MKFSLEQLEEDKVMHAFNIMLHNILICFRSFRNFQDSDVKSENNEYWLSQGSKKLAKSTQKAFECLKHIRSYFPEIRKLHKFLDKYDSFIGHFEKTLATNKLAEL